MRLRIFSSITFCAAGMSSVVPQNESGGVVVPPVVPPLVLPPPVVCTWNSHSESP